MMQLIDPAPHEFAANFVFDEHGLDPYFAADSQVKAGGGSQNGRFEHDGDRWVVKLYYQTSGLLPPDGGKTPAGTPWQIEQVREFRIQVKLSGDPVGKKRFNAHISPRWQGLKAEKSDGYVTKVSVPADIEEGVNVRVSGANIPFEKYQSLLQEATEAIGIKRWYFKSPHPFSNVVDAARYVRLHTDHSGPVHARDGPIAKMGHLLEDDRSGYRKLVQNDQNNRGERLPGNYHTVTLGPKRVREAFPDHTFPREIKHYYAREALSFTKDHPLRHPKMEVAYQRSKWDGKIGVDEIDSLEAQLDQTIYSVLAEAGIQVHVGAEGGGPYFSDAYFKLENINRPEEWIYNMDLARIRHDQESVVLKYLADGLSPVDWENLSTLVTDGGELSPTDLAGQNGRHVDSVRRSLRRMEDLLDREYGRVRLRSPFIAGLLHRKIELARQATRDAAEATAKVAYAAERGLDEHTSAFIAWAAAMGVEVDDKQDARLKIRMNEFEDFKRIRRHLKQGYELWINAGQDPMRFREAKVYTGERTITTAWQLL